MESFYLTIPRPTKAPTPKEEMLKLNLLDITRKKKQSVFEMYDETLIQIKALGLHASHKAMLIDEKIVEVIRLQHDLAIIRLESKKEVKS